MNIDKAARVAEALGCPTEYFGGFWLQREVSPRISALLDERDTYKARAITLFQFIPDGVRVEQLAQAVDEYKTLLDERDLCQKRCSHLGAAMDLIAKYHHKLMGGDIAFHRDFLKNSSIDGLVSDLIEKLESVLDERDALQDALAAAQRERDEARGGTHETTCRKCGATVWTRSGTTVLACGACVAAELEAERNALSADLENVQTELDAAENEVSSLRNALGNAEAEVERLRGNAHWELTPRPRAPRLPDDDMMDAREAQP